MQNTLINVSNRLPISVKNGEMTKSSGGLVAALEGLPKGHYQQKWIGWPGAEITDKKEQEQIGRKLADEYGCIPVFLGKEEAAAVEVFVLAPSQCFWLKGRVLIVGKRCVALQLDLLSE